MATVGTGVITRAASTSDLSPNAASASGDKFTAGHDVWLFLENTSGAPITVTVTTPGTVRGQAIADLTISVPAGGYAVRGPWPADTFGDAGGLVSLTYSTHTGLSFGAWKVGA
ncbi:hypothetical protein [Micromonospora inyonensis]|uniref:Uncharacterized protein n=1 Tax=Micromonospora inyonensis TaxID=47866 RepID=A0A1C6RD78_9ACTN|nr:hypothetical protein [Micromonospora inyonensis]SCL15061.1 hypothetical protein GA0074694_1035 [Micromonospora inyonensis]